MKQLLAVSLAAFGLTTSTTVRVTPADGRRLAEQAFAQDGDPRYTLVLAPGPEAFKIAGDRVTLSATATLHFGVDFTCPVRISGRPVIRGNRVGLEAPDITSDDWSCRSGAPHCSALRFRHCKRAVGTSPWLWCAPPGTPPIRAHE